MKKRRVVVVGAGAVGAELVLLLREREFPLKELTILARSERRVTIGGISYAVKVAESDAFKGADFVFFAGTEGEKGASQTWGAEAVAHGCIVIDNGDDFRMNPGVPLVIPEVNGHALVGHNGFIANPNCSTIIALMPLAPLHRVAKIRRIVASTYQAVSGTGTGGTKELTDQVGAWVKKESLLAEVYPHQIAFNVIPQVGSFKDDSGESTEEVKMRNETWKILEDSSIRIAATCVRVPVLNGHSIALSVEFEKELSPEDAREILRNSPGICVVDMPREGGYPTPLSASQKYEVEVGRIRRDPSTEKGLLLWCSGDNIWKGAAQNAIQIAEALL